VALAGGVEEKLRDALAKVLALPAGAFAESATLAQKVRESMKSRKAYLDTGVLFGEAATDKAIDLLGDKSDDPSLEDLQTVIPSLIELYGLDAVRLMAVQYSTSLGGFRKLVSTDSRFAIPATQATTSATSSSQTSSVDAAAQEAKRKQRAERKQKDKEARSKAELQRRAARGRI
jgi:hypothetical protein